MKIDHKTCFYVYMAINNTLRKIGCKKSYIQLKNINCMLKNIILLYAERRQQ